MTGEDMIIKAAAKVLSESPTRVAHVRELREAFWVAGRCESCGEDVQDVHVRTPPTCGSCGIVVINRRAANRTELPDDDGFRAPVVEKGTGFSACCRAEKEWRATHGALTAALHCTICDRIIDTRPNAPRVEGPPPIPLILNCPSCGARHVDKGSFATHPHHTHACQGCGLPWRPAIEPTVGVQFLPGFKDEGCP